MELCVEKLEQEKSGLIARLGSHDFLQRCRAGSIGRDELMTFLVQHGIYSSQFTKYLCALMSNLTSNADVRAVAENLFEELGLGEADAMPHHILYRNMLSRFSLSSERAKPLSGTIALMSAMFKHCRNSNPSYGLGALCLGAEALVPHFYADIVRGFSQCGVAETELEFFKLHIACDDKHAETIRDIMATVATQAPDEVHHMISAGRELVEARRSFLTSIEEFSRARADAV